jgi:acyl-CoA synthetase (AMP-forming)/AMP-acid ligase II
VPSSIGIMATLRLVKPGAFPSIRASIFCGEPLAADHAAQWQAATPNGVIENFYGPTETTVAITRYRWPRAGAPATGVVPIGCTFPDQRHRLIDPAGVEVAPGETGELCFAGDQVAAGYWANPAETAVRFTQLPGGDERWYRTGDLAREDAGGCLHFLGRIDEQVKVRGFRVELQEIDHAVRAAAGAALVATVAWPVRHGSAEGIVAFIASDGAVDEAAILAQCRARLPDYMVPRSIRRVDVLPLSSNGKTDRRALIQRLEEEESDAGSRTA